MKRARLPVLAALVPIVLALAAPAAHAEPAKAKKPPMVLFRIEGLLALVHGGTERVEGLTLLENAALHLTLPIFVSREKRNLLSNSFELSLAPDSSTGVRPSARPIC